MLLEVVSANYLGDYKVFLTFNNGYKAPLDLEETILNERRMIFHPLRQQDYFRNFMVKLNTICWENEVDFAPEFLYDLARQQAERTGATLKQVA